MEASEAIIPITLFLATAGILYVHLSTRHKERMAMIDKGADPALFQSRRDGRFMSMRIGMFLIGISLGILLGNVLAETTSLKEEVAYFSMIFLMGGISLVAYYLFIEKRKSAV